jgi:hypothetical protein
MAKKQAATAARSPRWKRWSEAEAATVVEAWRQSRLSFAAYGRQTGISVRRLARWARRVAPAAAEPVRFHPVRVRPATSAATSIGNVIEVLLGDGTLIRVAPGFAAADLGLVLDVLKERS